VLSETGSLHILHIEDDPAHAELVRRALQKSGLTFDIHLVMSEQEYLNALDTARPDVILSDTRGLDFEGLDALRHVRRRSRRVPFVFVSSHSDDKNLERLKAEGATDCVLKSELDRLPAVIQRALEKNRKLPSEPGTAYLRGMERLVTAVQELSLARDLPSIQAIVRHAARELTDADGATFILREGDMCHYADEEAIAPLWKGQRFPMSACISGWAMLNHEVAVIEDIYADPRIPHDAYRPTFVKSLAMVPIRTLDPIGAIGNYWADQHLPSEEEVKLLRALADSTAVAMENVRVQAELERRVQERTAELEAVNKELEAFSYSVSHDLRGPLRSISGFSKLVLDDYGSKLDENGRRFLGYIDAATRRMSELIDDLLKLSRVNRASLKKEPVRLDSLAREVVADLKAREPERRCTVEIGMDIMAEGDARLMKTALENLIGNAWKFTGKRQEAHIVVGRIEGQDGPVFFVRDNGAGFEQRYADKLFVPFQRLHGEAEFPGNGVGLATVQRIITRHGGRIWAEAEEDRGATFYFTLGGPA
jgi:signal transduction histidine kinase/CheY-like chemotaxis protein